MKHKQPWTHALGKGWHAGKTGRQGEGKEPLSCWTHILQGPNSPGPVAQGVISPIMTSFAKIPIQKWVSDKAIWVNVLQSISSINIQAEHVIHSIGANFWELKVLHSCIPYIELK